MSERREPLGGVFCRKNASRDILRKMPMFLVLPLFSYFSK